MKWGLALSGGGSWGIANGGIIEVLDSNNIKPNYISGSSMGAIIGALYALGYPPSVFTDLVNDISLWNIANFKRKTLKGGLHAGILSQNISKLLNPLIGDALIEDCKIPFVCVAGKVSNPIKWQNILLGSFTDEISETVELHVFSKQTRIVDAIMASSAIPVLFSPVEIDGDSFIDLCSFGAIPTRTLRDTYHPDIIVATKTTPTYKYIKKLAPFGLRKFLEAGQKSLSESVDVSDLIIEPKLSGNVACFNLANKFYNAGKKAGERNIDTIINLISN